MASLEPPHRVSPHAVTYRVQSPRGLAPMWAVAASVAGLCALGNAFAVPIATLLFSVSTVMFCLAAVVGTIATEVEIGLHRVRISMGVLGLSRRSLDLPWEALASAHVERGRLVLVLRSGARRRTPVTGDPGQVAWVAGMITHRADRARLSEDAARALVRDRAALESLRSGVG